MVEPTAWWTAIGQVWSRSVKRNALTPILAMVLLILAATFAFRDDPSVKALLVWMVLGLVILFAIAYVWFAVRHPDRLQSEKYQIDRRAQELQVQGHPPLSLSPLGPNPQLTGAPKALGEPES